MYLQDNNFFCLCQVRNEDIDISYVALYIIYCVIANAYSFIKFEYFVFLKNRGVPYSDFFQQIPLRNPNLTREPVGKNFFFVWK